ncbi:N-acyl-D-amino-acid deacylase family protein [Mycobacterium paraterrae]|uniref:Amidohydrolase family protein n=1 Tax=Mycobacterium paraterrae TaxID=577492 RepID=A0ABY3VHV2_9MYCO|nr:amidohydrolase family protein [Mycobacterium paraterrae]UMB68186.1 amidohydrolase family protein [Mycobacterium paraterrae]
MPSLDVVIRGGTVFDGTGAAPITADVGIRDGKVATIGHGLPEGARTVDARGRWVLPGLIDVHTHYDAEVLISPGLGESARHGTTSVILGNCSLSTVYSDADDCADMFARVEALPWQIVHDAVKEAKTWCGPAEYVKAVDSLPLGVNVAAFIGHSDIRAAVLGLGQSVDADYRPTRAQITQMQQMLAEALDAGFIGLSTLRSSFSKLEGTRFPARQLPSTYATWSEFSALNTVLRQRGRVHQSTPNLARQAEVSRYLAQSIGRRRRKALKTTLIAAADVKADRRAARLTLLAAGLTNLAGGNFRWQHLPVPFEMYADGVDLVVFEEFGSGSAALNFRDEMSRGKLLADESYRRRFRKDMTKQFGPRVWSRDLSDAEIVACPDQSVVGKSFADVAEIRGIEPADALLDLTVEHGARLRWRTVVANDREEVLDRMQRSPNVQIGFSDSGAHLRNMAFYNSGLRMLERVHHRRSMPVETAVRRLTGELADWYGLDAGYLREGKRADIAIVDPAGFDGSSAAYAEAPYPGAPDVKRMVNRNDELISATLVGGHIVYEAGEFAPGFGTDLRAGRFLAAVTD